MEIIKTNRSATSSTLIGSPIFAPAVAKPYIEIIINNQNVTKILNEYVLSVRYTDYLKGQSDELEIVLKNPNNLFNSQENYPVKGNKISAKIGYAGEKLLDCGIFAIDEISFSGGTDGESINIKALAVSIKQNIREKKSKSYINKTLVEIAKEIGAKHNFEVKGTDGHLKLSCVSQYNESDLAFLYRISESYGYIFKITDNVLTFTKLETLENAEPLTVISRNDLSSYNFTDTSAKTYKACTVQYYNPKTGKYQSITVKSNKSDTKGDTLKIKEKFTSKAQAQERAKAGLKNGQKMIKGTINLKKGNVYFMAGTIHKFSDFSLLDGNYQVVRAEHNITIEDYTVSGEVEKNA